MEGASYLSRVRTYELGRISLSVTMVAGRLRCYLIFSLMNRLVKQRRSGKFLRVGNEYIDGKYDCRMEIEVGNLAVRRPSQGRYVAQSNSQAVIPMLVALDLSVYT